MSGQIFRRGVDRLALVESRHAGGLVVITCQICATSWEREKSDGRVATVQQRQDAGWHALDHERKGERSPAFVKAERERILEEAEKARTNYEDVVRDPESADKVDRAWDALQAAQEAVRALDA